MSDRPKVPPPGSADSSSTGGADPGGTSAPPGWEEVVARHRRDVALAERLVRWAGPDCADPWGICWRFALLWNALPRVKGTRTTERVRRLARRWSRLDDEAVVGLMSGRPARTSAGLVWPVEIGDATTATELRAAVGTSAAPDMFTEPDGSIPAAVVRRLLMRVAADEPIEGTRGRLDAIALFDVFDLWVALGRGEPGWSKAGIATDRNFRGFLGDLTNATGLAGILDADRLVVVAMKRWRAMRTA